MSGELNLALLDRGDRPVKRQPETFHLPPSETGVIPTKYPLLAQEQGIVGPLVENLQLLIGLGVTASVATLGASIFFSGQLPDWAKTALLSVSLGSSAATTATLCLSGNQNLLRMQNAINQAREKQIQSHLNSEVIRSNILLEIENNDWLVQQVMKLPIEQQLKYLKQYKLTDLVPWYTEAVEAIAPPPPVSIYEGHQDNIRDASFMDADMLDFSWIDQEFVEAPKAIFGASRSGKTRVMAILVYQFMHYNPDGEIRIIDAHFSERPDGITKENHKELTDDDSLWFLGVPDSFVKDNYVISFQGDSKGRYQGPDEFCRQTIAMYERMYRLLQYRKQKGMKSTNGGNKKWHELGGFKFHLVHDEFFAAIKQIASYSKKAAERITNVIIPTVAFEARKFGITFTLGLHSLKKGSVDIDSDVLLANMSLLMLGAALNDPNTPLPTDVADQRIETFAAMQQIQEALEPKTGYACAVRKKNSTAGGSERLKVEVIPHINFSDVWFNFVPKNSRGLIESAIEEQLISLPETDEGNSQTGQKKDFKSIFVSLRNWYESINPKPSDEEILIEYERISGEQVLPNAGDTILKVVKGEYPIE